MPHDLSNLLVPLDGSELAEQALPMAARLVRNAGDSLHLVAVHRALPSWGAIEDAIATTAWDAAGMGPEAAYLENIARRLRAEGITVTTAIRQGQVAHALAEYATEQHVDAIVMTSHGRGGFSRFWLGSVADRLAKQATVPVLCLRPSEPEKAGDGSLVTRILVPLDGSPLAEEALGPAIALASRLHADVELFRVVDPTVQVWTGAMEIPITFVPEDLVKAKAEAHRYLQDVKAGVRARAIQVVATVATAERPANAIAGRAREHGRMLVAMTTHGGGRLARAILGSVTDKVLRSAPGPVLVCHAPAAVGKTPVPHTVEA